MLRQSLFGRWCVLQGVGSAFINFKAGIRGCMACRSAYVEHQTRTYTGLVIIGLWHQLVMFHTVSDDTVLAIVEISGHVYGCINWLANYWSGEEKMSIDKICH